jgi:hypothetical protein
MERELNIQELITLYADGATTREQERVLFNAIADDSELQREFRTAMKIQSLLTPESDDISEEVDTALFTRLGIGEEKKKRGLILPLFSSLRLAVNGYQAVGVQWSKAALILIALGVGVWKGSEFMGNEKQSSLQSTQHYSSESKSSKLVASTSKQGLHLSPQNEIFSSKQVDRTSSNGHSSNRVSTTTEKSSAIQTKQFLASNNPQEHTTATNLGTTTNANSYQKTTQQQSQTLADNSTTIEKIEDRKVITPTVTSSSLVNTPSVVLNPNVQLKERTLAEQRPFQQSISENPAVSTANSTSTTRFSFEARGGQNISSSAGSNVGLNNFSLSAMYRISDNDWAGVFVGTSSSAVAASISGNQLTTKNDSPDPDLNGLPAGPDFGSNMQLRASKEADSLSVITPGLWFGAAFEHRFGNQYHTFRPTARLAVGAWGVRPFSRANVGVAVRILRNVNTTLGLEGTMMYEPRGVYAKGWESGIGGVAGLSVEF